MGDQFLMSLDTSYGRIEGHVHPTPFPSVQQFIPDDVYIGFPRVLPSGWNSADQNAIAQPSEPFYPPLLFNPDPFNALPAELQSSACHPSDLIEPSQLEPLVPSDFEPATDSLGQSGLLQQHSLFSSFPFCHGEAQPLGVEVEDPPFAGNMSEVDLARLYEFTLTQPLALQAFMPEYQARKEPVPPPLSQGPNSLANDMPVQPLHFVSGHGDELVGRAWQELQCKRSFTEVVQFAKTFLTPQLQLEIRSMLPSQLEKWRNEAPEQSQLMAFLSLLVSLDLFAPTQLVQLLPRAWPPELDHLRMRVMRVMLARTVHNSRAEIGAIIRQLELAYMPMARSEFSENSCELSLEEFVEMVKEVKSRADVAVELQKCNSFEDMVRYVETLNVFRARPLLALARSWKKVDLGASQLMVMLFLISRSSLSSSIMRQCPYVPNLLPPRWPSVLESVKDDRLNMWRANNSDRGMLSLMESLNSSMPVIPPGFLVENDDLLGKIGITAGQIISHALWFLQRSPSSPLRKQLEKQTSFGAMIQCVRSINFDRTCLLVEEAAELMETDPQASGLMALLVLFAPTVPSGKFANSLGYELQIWDYLPRQWPPVLEDIREDCLNILYEDAMVSPAKRETYARVAQLYGRPQPVLRSTARHLEGEFEAIR